MTEKPKAFEYGGEEFYPAKEMDAFLEEQAAKLVWVQDLIYAPELVDAWKLIEEIKTALRGKELRGI